MTRYNLISLAEIPEHGGTSLFALDHSKDTRWTQEADMLLLMLDHPGLLTISARTHAYEAWTVFAIPPGNRCSLRPTGGEVPCAVWMRFTPSGEGAPIVAVPHMTTLGEMGPLWNRRIRKALNRTYQMRRENRVVMADLLWYIAEDPGTVRQSDVLENAEAYIEENLSEPFRIDELAAIAGVSHSQLIRLFKEEHGITPQVYVRHRRQYHACRMLIETKLMAKQIASAVGISDLAQFNRLVQDATGMSPRRFRAATRPPDLFRVEP